MREQNRYYRRDHISERKFRQLVRYFAMDFTAADTPQLTGLTRKSITVIFLKIRQRIAEECERASPLSGGEVEVNESYMGALSACAASAGATAQARRPSRKP